jgi:hypothetical protein
MFLLRGNCGPDAQWIDLATLSPFTSKRTFSLLLGGVNRFVQTALSPKTLTEGIKT